MDVFSIQIRLGAIKTVFILQLKKTIIFLYFAKFLVIFVFFPDSGSAGNRSQTAPSDPVSPTGIRPHEPVLGWRGQQETPVLNHSRGARGTHEETPGSCSPRAVQHSSFR